MQPTDNIEAYNLYLQGCFHFSKGTPEGFAKGKDYYEQALAIDPEYSPAWYGIAFYFFLLTTVGLISPKVANEQCRRATKKALESDETLPEAHMMTALLLMNEFDWEGVRREFLKALGLAPRSAEIRNMYA
jgi:Tfp pilus assembly protein PilF